MLGEAGMKKLFSLKMLDVDDIRKAPLTQYVRWGWYERALSY